MGLDGVEIAMGIEDAFDIRLADEEAAELRTPRDVVNLVAARVPTRPAAACVTGAVRRALVQGLAWASGERPSDVTLETRLRTLVAKKEWPELWTRVRRAVGSEQWPASVPWPGLLRPGPKTVRDLVLDVCLALPPPDPGEPWTREDIAFAVRRVVTDVMGYGHYASGDRFVEDMGVD